MSETAPPVQRGWVDRVQLAARRLAVTIERMFKLIRRPTKFGQTLDPEDSPRRRSRWCGRSSRNSSRSSTCVPNHSTLTSHRTSAAPRSIPPSSPISSPTCSSTRSSSPPTAAPSGLPLTVSAASRESSVPGRRRGCRDLQAADRPHLFQPFFTGFDTMHHSSGDFQFVQAWRSAWASASSRRSSNSTAARSTSIAPPGQGTTFELATIPRLSTLGEDRRGSRFAG